MSEIIDTFLHLGKRLNQIGENHEIVNNAYLANPWFLPKNILLAIKGIRSFLEPNALIPWMDPYDATSTPRRIGIVMAGNLPLVGFHDLLCVLLSGHKAIVKLSHQDSVLMGYIINEIKAINPLLDDFIVIKERLTDIDAVLATGSDNTSRYFEYYFRDIPKIIRKNRTSVAILTGDETPDEHYGLGHDLFDYFGMGCRNVSKVFIPKNYDIRTVFPSIQSFAPMVEHHKYRNNYEYNKVIYLLQQIEHYDTGFNLWKMDSGLVSPLSVIFYGEYDDISSLSQYLTVNASKIQCIIGHGNISFGKAQHPKVDDYADGINTMDFLVKL